MKCPLDEKRCYVHYHVDDGLPKRCRQGYFIEGTFCPAEIEIEEDLCEVPCGGEEAQRKESNESFWG